MVKIFSAAVLLYILRY